MCTRDSTAQFTPDLCSRARRPKALSGGPFRGQFRDSTCCDFGMKGNVSCKAGNVGCLLDIRTFSKGLGSATGLVHQAASETKASNRSFWSCSDASL